MKDRCYAFVIFCLGLVVSRGFGVKLTYLGCTWTVKWVLCKLASVTHLSVVEEKVVKGVLRFVCQQL